MTTQLSGEMNKIWDKKLIISSDFWFVPYILSFPSIIWADKIEVTKCRKKNMAVLFNTTAISVVVECEF